MQYLFCKHKVEDYDKWRKVFDSHLTAREESGLEILHVLRDVTDPNDVAMLFKVHDLEKSKAFTDSPTAHEAADTAGVIGVPEVLYLTD